MSLPIFILNGPNLNLLGEREPHIYGATTLAQIEAACASLAAESGHAVVFRQTNHEGVLIDWVHEARKAAMGLILNAGGLTHTSISLLDALKALTIPKIEVHLSQPASREEFRHHSFVALGVNGSISGFGPMSYRLAVQALVDLTRSAPGPK